MANEKSGSLAQFKEPEKQKSFGDLISVMMPQFKAALPAHLKTNAERYMRMAVTEMRRNPALNKCDPYSVLGAAMVATQLGLEIGPTGRAYLIPYGNQCTFVPGWKGLVELAMRSGRAACWSGVIYQDQTHEYEQGDSPRLKITSDSDEFDPAKIAYAYAIGRITGSDWPIIERWSVAKITKHRDRFNKVGTRHYSFENWEMYARKVPLLQVLKYMPASPELEAAIILDAGAEQGRTLDVQGAADAIDGVFAVEPQSPGPGSPSSSGAAPVAGVSGQDAGGPPKDVSNAQADAYAMADDAIKSKDFDTARSYLDKLAPADRKIIEGRLPKEAK
jgi:recombination protein RecT